MTDQELRDLVGSLAVAQKETDRQLKETDRQVSEMTHAVKQTERSIEQFRQIQEKESRELRKQVGGLSNKFGDFAEGMALPSLIEILAKRFHAEQIIETRRMRKHDQELELDLIGATNGENKVVEVAEVKSSLNQRELDKFVHNLSRFFFFFPQFKGYKLYGVIAAIDSSDEMEKAALRQGIAVARMHEDIFRLKEPPDFRPRDFAESN